jgi:signal transduction histidine kinase
MHTFRNMPIKLKLMVIIMATTSAALLLSGVGIVILDSILFRSYLNLDLSALSRIIADNSTAAIAFDDPQAAVETLSALRARTHIVAACIYRKDGTTLATYARPGAGQGCRAPDARDEIRFNATDLTVSRPILLKDRLIGILAMVYDLDEIKDRRRIYGAGILGILVASNLIAFVLSSKLRTVISTPILELVHATTAVSKTRDYSVRAQKLSGDELGALVDAFNEMLAGIESRDDRLKEALLDREEALTEAQSARDSLQRSNGELARSNEDLERFAFVASHDLQDPLRMITVYSQLLVKSYPPELDNQARMFVNNIAGGTKRMRELLADLLAYTEIGSRPDTPVEVVDLNVVIENVRQILKASSDDTGAEVTAGRLPSLTGYEAHFISLFQNLIGNAIKYRSERSPRIDISVQEAPGELRFAVADNGIGIDSEYHQTIFGAFKRLHGNKIPGTGIGLAICQRVVERYGGQIWVESNVGQGATFLFTLPARLVRPEERE